MTGATASSGEASVITYMAAYRPHRILNSNDVQQIVSSYHEANCIAKAVMKIFFSY